jgi:DNA-binding response OmpR family regulator
MAKRILIVEDDPVARHILQTALAAAKYEANVVADAMQALPVAQKNRPDLIILDLGLPAGGGMTFLKRLKVFPALATIPILVVSGQDRAKSEGPARELGAVAYLQKPVGHDDVVAEVKRILGD